MNRLVINTANSELIVAVNKNGEIFSRVEYNKKHNEVMLDFVESVLKDSALTLNDIDEFGVVVGPGSFTGIRVGIATIKGFKNALNKTAKGINNLEFLYTLSKSQSLELVAIEGSLNSFFVAEVINDNLYIYPRNLTCEELISIAGNRNVGCFKLSDFMKECGINFVEVPLDVNALFECMEKSKDENLTPVYYQLSQAENDKINRGKLELVQYDDNYFNDIINIEQENFKEDITGDSSWSEKLLKECADSENSVVYLAILNDKLAGYIIGEITDEINLSRVAVRKEYQNHGIATKLIERLYGEAKANNMILSLEVCEHNVTAKKLYEKLGFVVRRIRKSYYKDGSSCIEMVKE